MIYYRLPAFVFLVFLAAACDSREHRKIELSGVDSNLSNAPPLDCRMEFNGIVDNRHGKQPVGPSLHAYEIKNLIAYFDNRIDALVNFGETASDLTLELRHVYAQGKAMRGFYTVVMVARLADNPPIILRGRHDATNWAGSSKEFRRGLAAAADQAVLGLYELLSNSGLCLPSRNT